MEKTSWPSPSRKLFSLPGFIAFVFLSLASGAFAFHFEHSWDIALQAAAVAAGIFFFFWTFFRWKAFFVCLNFLFTAAVGMEIHRRGGSLKTAALGVAAVFALQFFWFFLASWRRDVLWLWNIQGFLYAIGRRNLREIKAAFPPWGNFRRAVAWLKPLKELLNEAAKQAARSELTLERFLGSRAAAFARRLGGKQIWHGESANVCVLFADLRGFTALAERLPPAQIVTFLNRFFREAEKHISASGGEINKYLGDAVLAFFPFSTDRPEKGPSAAADAALNLSDAFRRLHENFDATYSASVKEVGLGLGLAAGPVVLGNVGSPDRMEFTLIGDTVNLASRFCSIAEDGQILINETMASLLSETYRLETLGPVRLKGKSQPQIPYLLLGRGFSAG